MEAAEDADRSAENRAEVVEQAKKIDGNLTLMAEAAGLPETQGDLLILTPKPLNATPEQAEEFAEQYRALIRAGDLDGAFELVRAPSGVTEQGKLHDSRVAAQFPTQTRDLAAAGSQARKDLR